MKAIELLKSISDRAKATETFDDSGKLKHSEKSGWMSKKQADFLISLLERERFETTKGFGFEFWVDSYKISKPISSGQRTWRLIERY